MTAHAEPVGGPLDTPLTRRAGGVVRPRRCSRSRGGCRRPRRHDRAQRRLSARAVDRLRRRHRHGARLRRLRGRLARLHPEQGPVSPAGAAGDADQRARLLAGGRRRAARRRPLVEASGKCRCTSGTGTSTRRCSKSRSASWPTSWCCGSSCRRRCSRNSSTARFCRCGASREDCRRSSSKRVAVDHRARPAAADDAPVVARHADAAGRIAAAPAVAHAAAAAAVPDHLRLDGLRGRRVRVGVLERRVQAAAGDADARAAWPRPSCRCSWSSVALRLADLRVARAASGSLFAGDAPLGDGAARIRAVPRAGRDAASPPRRRDLGHLVARGDGDDVRRRALSLRYVPGRVHAGRALVVLPERAGDADHRRPRRVRGARLHRHRQDVSDSVGAARMAAPKGRLRNEHAHHGRSDHPHRGAPAHRRRGRRRRREEGVVVGADVPRHRADPAWAAIRATPGSSRSASAASAPRCTRSRRCGRSRTR